MSEKKTRSDTAFRLDCFLALHQRACWIAAAALAVLGAVLIVRLVPASAGTYCTLGLAFLIMAAYRWVSAAPRRALKGWADKAKAPEEFSRRFAQDFWDYLMRMEKALPGMQKKEMAYSLTCWKAALLSALGKKQEALHLLQSFDQIWDESQREQIQKMIAKLTGDSSPDSPEKGA